MEQSVPPSLLLHTGGVTGGPTDDDRHGRPAMDCYGSLPTNRPSHTATRPPRPGKKKHSHTRRRQTPVWRALCRVTQGCQQEGLTAVAGQKRVLAEHAQMADWRPMLTAITLDAHWQEKKKIRGPRVTNRQNTRNAVRHKTPLSLGLFFLRSTRHEMPLCRGQRHNYTIYGMHPFEKWNLWKLQLECLVN